MLTLVDQLRVGSFAVYRDVVQGPGGRAYSSIFYALPDLPRLATDGDGGPAFDFLWYRAPPGDDGVPDAGGLVTLTAVLGPDEGEREQLRDGIRAAVDPPPSDPTIVSVPFVAGEVSLRFAGDPGGDLATTAPRAPASLQGDERATFVVPLTRDGAGLLGQALETGADLFHVRYELTFVHRLDEVSLRIWCDGRRAHDLATARAAGGVLDVPSLATAIVTDRIGGVELESTRPVGDEQRRTLEAVGQRLLEAAIAAAVVDDAGQGPLRLRPYTPEMDSSLNVTFSESYPVEVHAVGEATLRVGSLADLGDRVRRVELDRGFFRILEVKILSTVDFAGSPIESVRVVVRYDATGTTRVQRQEEFVFREGTGPQTFRTDLAAPDQRAVSYDADVFYRDGGPPMRVSQPARETELIVLDLDGAGVLRVAAALRDVPADANLSATLELRHEASGHDAAFVLDRAHPSLIWTQVVREQTGPYAYRVTWIGPDGVSEPTEWTGSSQSELALDAPARYRPTAEVYVVAAGDFTEVAELLVELRSGEAAPASFSFTASGQAEVWRPPVAVSPFSYEVRQWLVYRDGSRQELPWAPRDTPVLVVGDLLRFDVVVTPRLLDLGASARLALVELVRDATHNAAARTTLVFRDTESQTWSFRMSEPGAHAYRYQLTLVRADGQRAVSEWQDADAGVLVLQSTDTSPEH